MPLIVVFDEGASPERVLMVLPSTEEAEFLGRTDYLVDPDISALQGIVARRYWKHEAGAIIEYTPAEKATQDAVQQALWDQKVREAAKDELADFKGTALMIRAAFDVVKDEINVLRAEHSLAPRTLAQLRNAINARIDDGSVDS